MKTNITKKKKTPTIIAVVGTKKSGKTTTTENLIRELTERGYKVAAIKHIHIQNWTIDTPGKDTYRFAQAGAKTVIATSDNEIATIEKISTPPENLKLQALTKKITNTNPDTDIILIEGLKELVAENKSILKIVPVKTQQEAENALESYSPILAFTGPHNTDADNLNMSIPYADAQTTPEKLADIIEKKLRKTKNNQKC